MREQKQYDRILAPLLAFLVPGAGHLVLGQHLKGLLLLMSALTDIVAMLRFADEGGGSYALLIVFLGLAIPFFWFYSVFDTLQQGAYIRQFGEAGNTDEQRQNSGVVAFQGAAVILVALILLLLVRAPSVLTSWLETIGSYLPGIGLIILALLVVMKRGKGMFKLGRITSATVILVVGGLLLWDQLQGRNDIGVLGQWWPAAFVMLGIEVVVYSFINRSRSRRLSFDIGGSFIAVVIAVTAFAVTQYAAMPLRWLDDFKVNFAGMSGFGEEKGFMYTKEKASVPIGPDTKTISIDNPNGKVSVKKGEGNEVTVETVMWVDVTDKKEADSVAEQSKVAISEGEKLSIQAKGQPYGANGNRKPRMNMIITIPASSVFALPIVKHEESPVDTANKINETSSPVDSSNSVTAVEPEAAGSASPNNKAPLTEEPVSSKINIVATNGSVDIAGLVLPGGLNIKITSGEAKLSNLFGPVNVQTKNGDITAAAIEGNVQLATYNGSVKAQQITGEFEGSTLSGNMELKHITGHIEADTKNGEIIIKEAQSSIKAGTLNGDIEIHSAAVGGNWDIDSSIGDIRLYVPEQGNFSVNGSVTFGTVSSELPLISTKKTISGDIGAATYRIDIDANSSIAVNRYSP
ncbi:hypothetical protein Back11_60390 [Paenibacillus baekrokdamisoli]|uniref:DUF4097 domain-containing protein n=1 Tax=Paenibacillus baekrokdamisoli TaxID=1712516 RepID=A0A3G9JPB4_9BACL|nr:DUF6677 family protein [Paenibacillus baekrokdamisoli]MBB3071270.1 DUF4097 and DUF4098 domain-containing protein YvlB/TM2 domain-containing membrane protein YozV [Paenibacillus baekrokdamisoli]BBH24694.1 hypothetical protein Back11_60390 [Paenibacillus baekrokdamisoli]